MPYADVNGARLFYRDFGSSDDHPPIVLIHGATVDGRTDWGALAPVLGLQHQVLVLDCRGHGRSANPSGGYSFRQLAADVAELIRVLGHDKAHIVGHSNGGNVALVTLLEHPDVVATCVIQAANAFVSPDLVEKEPSNFAADRVERQEPAWRDQMMKLHGRWHGRDYWRDLLAMTVAEIVSQPNYAADDLARANRPVLVIEGQEDRVNAASRHGEFIERNIPGAELWQPPAVGHAVHEQVPSEWLARLESFWARRGTPMGDALWRLHAGNPAIPRNEILDYEVGNGRREVSVAVLTDDLAAEVRRLGVDLGVDPVIHVLTANAKPARVRRGVVDVLAHPAPDAPRVTQALHGERLLILDERAGFVRVRLDADGYLGWLRADALDDGPTGTGDVWRVWSDVALGCSTPGGPVVDRLPFGATIDVVAERAGWIATPTAAGLAWLPAADTRSGHDVNRLEAVTARFRRFVGIPYLWGGRTPFGFDCSGLAQAFWRELGVAIPRDADQQCAAGAMLDGEPEPGDLAFFGDPGRDDGQRASHVAIALDREWILHAWGAADSVAVSDLNSADPRVARLRDNLIGWRRYRRPPATRALSGNATTRA